MHPLFNLTAMIEAERTVDQQFHDIPEADRPELVPRKRSIWSRFEPRLRLSATLHALADAIEPAPPACEPAPSQQRC